MTEKAVGIHMDPTAFSAFSGSEGLFLSEATKKRDLELCRFMEAYEEFLGACNFGGPGI